MLLLSNLRRRDGRVKGAKEQSNPAGLLRIPGGKNTPEPHSDRSCREIEKDRDTLKCIVGPLRGDVGQGWQIPRLYGERSESNHYPRDETAQERLSM